MFTGKFDHTLDDKGRVAVPAQFRKKLGESDDLALMITIWDQCLVAYPRHDWEPHLTAVMAADPFNNLVQRLKRVFVGLAQECPVDKAGRVLIPQELRARAGIDKDCVLVGQLEKIEIWNPERWQKQFDESIDLLGPNYAALADRGLRL